MMLLLDLQSLCKTSQDPDTCRDDLELGIGPPKEIHPNDEILYRTGFDFETMGAPSANVCDIIQAPEIDHVN